MEKVREQQNKRASDSGIHVEIASWINNLADDPPHAAVRDEMAGLLKSGWRSAAP